LKEAEDWVSDRVIMKEWAKYRRGWWRRGHSRGYLAL
jgi:hypothetical protein